MFEPIRPWQANLGMLRKVLWSGLYAGIAAGTSLAARQLISRAWRLATGEAPPAKR
jgi:hypothetical protein